MAKLSIEKLRLIFKDDGCSYVQTSKDSERIDMNFPNMPNWYKEEWQEWCYDVTPHADVICFEYKGSKYKLLNNVGDPSSGFEKLFEANFGAVFHGDKNKVLNLVSSGDLKTRIQSLQADGRKIGNDLIVKLAPYLRFFDVTLHNNIELEYVVFKVLVENHCFGDFDDIDRRLVLK